MVGYKVRFTDKVRHDTAIKVMTDGILLAESQGDPLLSRYDTIIIDEAHERSLNIDFLLGYLKTLVEKRTDLRVVITSATIDAERFSKHFNDAPVIEVSGRTYPVEIRWRPIEREEPATPTKGEREKKDKDAPDQIAAILDATDELARLGSGDILVFLPGEREIRDTAEALQQTPSARHRNPAAVFPPVGRRAGRDLQADQRPAAHRAGDQRGGNLAHRAGHPLRDRPRHRAGEALFGAQQGRAAADREDLAGVGQPARRALRPGRRRRLHPPLRRSRLRQPSALHRSRTAALVAGRRHPAHEVARPGRRGGLPLHRSAEFAPGHRRLPAAGRTARARRSRGNSPRSAPKLAKLPLDPRIARMLLAAEQQRCVTRC